MAIDPRYQNAYIYNIINTASTDPRDIYVGSSINKTFVRFSQHRATWKEQVNGTRNLHMALYDAFTQFGIENFRIVVHEMYPCNNKQELLQREEYWRKQLQPNYNLTRAYRTEQERKDYRAKWMAKWRAENPEKQREIYQRQYHSRKLDCEACNYTTSSTGHYKRHLLSNKHKLEWAEYVYNCELDRLSYIYDADHE